MQEYRDKRKEKQQEYTVRNNITKKRQRYGPIIILLNIMGYLDYKSRILFFSLSYRDLHLTIYVSV